jgi:hypothetical protein
MDNSIQQNEEDNEIQRWLHDNDEKILHLPTVLLLSSLLFLQASFSNRCVASAHVLGTSTRCQKVPLEDIHVA